MNAINMLKADHKTVLGLFQKFEKMNKAQPDQKKAIVDQIVHELSVHAMIEEQIFYPAVRGQIPSQKDQVLEDLEEHHLVKWTLSEIDGMGPGEERFDAKVKVLIEIVRHHVQEEEKKLFPVVNKAFGRKKLDELGDQLTSAKGLAPTHPHPRAPDEPPTNVLLGTGAALYDRAKDKGRAIVEKVISRSNKRLHEASEAVKSTGQTAAARGSEILRKASNDTSPSPRRSGGRTSSRKPSAPKSAQRKSATPARPQPKAHMKPAKPNGKVAAAPSGKKPKSSSASPKSQGKMAH